MMTAVYWTVSDGRLPGSAHTRWEHLVGSPMTGSPSQWPGSNANPMRVCTVPGLRWMDRARRRVAGSRAMPVSSLVSRMPAWSYVLAFFEVAAGQGWPLA